MYVDPATKQIPQEYCDKSYLDYYVTQANDVINYLIKQKWVDNPARQTQLYVKTISGIRP